MKRIVLLCCLLICLSLACGKGGLRAQYATQTAGAPAGPAATQVGVVPSPTAAAMPPAASPPPARPALTRTPRAVQTRARPSQQTLPTRTLSPDLATRRAGQLVIQNDITYCVTDAGVSLALDIYQPRNARLPAPAVMYVHGGGWTGGDKSEGAGMTFRPELLQRGFIFVSINYRLAPEYEFPAHIEDVLCAVRFLRANAAQYGIDPERIGAIGGSAGGHLVSLLGTVGEDVPWQKPAYANRYDDQSHRVQAVVDLFGPADLPTMFSPGDNRQPWRLFGGSAPQDPALKLYSPVTYTSPDDPPFLILHGNQDEVVPLAQSQALLAALQSAPVEAELVVVKNAGHGFRPSGGELSPSMQELTRRVGEFFERWLRGR